MARSCHSDGPFSKGNSCDIGYVKNRKINEDRNSNVVQIFNMVHPPPALWQLLLATLWVRFGLRVEEVSLPKWLDRPEPGTLKLHGFLQAAGRGREYDMAFENKSALAVLPKVLPTTEDQLEACLMEWNIKLGDFKARMYHCFNSGAGRR
jgi:hypothetical protein